MLAFGHPSHADCVILAVLQRACTGGATPIVLTVVDTASTNIPSSQFSKIANTVAGTAQFQLQQVH